MTTTTPRLTDYVRDQLEPALATIGGFAHMCVLAGKALFRSKLTNNTVVAYFPETNALYVGDKVVIMGIRVGAIDKIEPVGERDLHRHGIFRCVTRPRTVLGPRPGNDDSGYPLHTKPGGCAGRAGRVTRC
jgi:MlaD protein